MRRLAPLLPIALALLTACTLPAGTSPTPFTFPTPNLTLTTIFSPSATDTSAPTLPPARPTDTPLVISTPAPPTATTPSTSQVTPPSGARPNESPAYAARLETPPVVDGDISDWATVAFLVDRCTFGCSAWSGLDDAYATYQLGWDSAALYVAVKVADDAHVQLARGARLYRGDSIEVQFDANLRGDFSRTTLSGDDFQIGLSPGDLDGLAPEAYRWFPSGFAGPVAAITVRARETDTGYMLEARIPWSVFGATPRAGDLFGFVVSISDNDAAGTQQQQSLISSVSTRKLYDPTTWGTLVLE
jgi:hypothetical protein